MRPVASIVRFRSDGSERRLLLAYAPLKRL